MFPGFRQRHILTLLGQPLIIKEPEEEDDGGEEFGFPQIRLTEVLFMDEYGIEGINMICGLTHAFDNRIEICGRGDDGDAEENDWDNYVYANSWDWMKHTKFYFQFCPDCLETTVGWSEHPPKCQWCGCTAVSKLFPATKSDYGKQMAVNKWWEEMTDSFDEAREAHLADCPPKPMTPEERKWLDEHTISWEQVKKNLGIDDDDDVPKE